MKWLKEPMASQEKLNSQDLSVEETVKGIIDQVKTRGDQALFDLTQKFDGLELKQISVNEEEIKEAYNCIDRETLHAVKKAAGHLEEFSRKQLSSLQPLEYEKMSGVILGHRLIPLSRAGCYVPSGRYPLPSSALMSIIPAKVAGVGRVMACSPPSKEYGTIHPLVLVAMDIAGADEIYAMGGAQAIAAYCMGTETVPAADMVAGPGNKYVAEAKRQLSGKVGIDLLAGPSEVLIIADKTADKQKVAVDLLAKCEHDPDAVAVLVTTSQQLGEEVKEEINRELPRLSTAEVARESWEQNGEIVLCRDFQEAVALANQRAPEHLQLMTGDDDKIADRLTNYGSLFIGEYAPVAFGDYCSGTNHILPTGKSARYTGGLWVGSFIKVLSYQKVSAQGAESLSEICSHLAEKEGLYGHKRSSDLRRQDYK